MQDLGGNLTRGLSAANQVQIAACHEQFSVSDAQHSTLAELTEKQSRPYAEVIGLYEDRLRFVSLQLDELEEHILTQVKTIFNSRHHTHCAQTRFSDCNPTFCD